MRVHTSGALPEVAPSLVLGIKYDAEVLSERSRLKLGDVGDGREYSRKVVSWTPSAACFVASVGTNGVRLSVHSVR